MWTSQRSAGEKSRYQPWVDQGEVTLSGDVMGVYLDGERRELRMNNPGGYHWKPAVGESVLVVNENEGEKVLHIIGSNRTTEPGRQLPLPEVEAGDVCVTSDGLAYVHLQGNDLRLQGNLYYNDVPIEVYLEKVIEAYLNPTLE